MIIPIFDASPDRGRSGNAAIAAMPPFWELEALISAGMDAPSALCVLAARRAPPAMTTSARQNNRAFAIRLSA